VLRRRRCVECGAALRAFPLARALRLLLRLRLRAGAK
jgi:hypothetical protein